MKKLFTLIFALCISLGAWADFTVTYDETVSPKTTTITTNGDVDLSGTRTVIGVYTYGTYDRTEWGSLNGLIGDKIIIVGAISQNGLNYLNNNLGNATKPFDFSQATQSGTWTSFPSQVESIVFSSGVTLPYATLVASSSVKYAYSPAGTSASIYVASGTTISDISELTSDVLSSLSSNSTPIILNGAGAESLKSELIYAGLTESQIDIFVPYVFYGNIEVVGGSVAQNISDAKAEHPIEITDDAITSITVTSGELTSEDLFQLSQLTNLETIILPNGTTSFPDLSSLTNFKKVVYKDAKDNYNVLIPKRGSSLDVSVIGDYDVAGTNVTITGELNGTDLASINGIANASMINLSGITIASGSSITSLVANGNAAIVLPSSITKAELGTLQNVGEDNPTYKCLAYPDATNANKLHLYTIQSSTIEHLYPLVNTSSSLYFEPCYKADGTFKNYMLDNNLEAKNIPTYVGKLPFADIDFSMVSVWLSTDFSVLNSYTRFITIPINGTYYDFTAEGVAYNNDGESYKYSNNIDVVSTFKSPGDTMHGSSCKYKGKKFEATENTNITYVRHAGTLGAASAYVNENMMSATRQIFVGNLNSSDVSAMEMMRATTFDFIDATISAENMKAFHNGYVLYLALPDNEESAIEATSADVCNYRDVNNSSSSKCPALLCVGAYNTTTNTLTTWSSAPGNVYKVTSLIRPQVATQIVNGQEVQVRGTGLICATLNNVIMSGQLNWDDISANNQNGKDNGLEGASIKSANMEYAYFSPNSEMVFSTAGWTGENSIEQITLPNNPKQTEIPALCLNNAKSLSATICIPYYYTKIGTNAFNNLPMTHVTATDAEGNVIDYGNKTFTLPAKLELIQAGAFWTSDETISDVYILATKAPKCEANAFSSGGLYGWGGFGGNNTHPMCREVYWNGSAKQFTMLHFPSDVTLDEAKKYTDVTRDYTLWDETGDYNGIGELRVWPNFSEIYRAYNQAVDGVTWDAWDLTRSKANLNDIPCWPTTYNDASGAPVNVEDTYYAGVLIPASTTPATSAEANGYVYDTNYMGWHQFVLADYHRYKEIVIEEASTYTDGGWYTLCIPFDMTEDEVIRVMGVPASATYTGNGYEITSGKNAGCNLPIVYSLQKVTRQNPNIKLGFSQELMKQIELNSQNLVFNNNGTITLGADTYNNGKTSGSGKKVLIKGGYPYLVRPIFPEGFNEAANVNGNLGKYILSVCSFTDENIGNKKEGTDIAAPIISQKLIAVNQAGAQVTYKEDGKPYYYFFQGTYTPQRMPQAYYINNGSWWRQTTAGVRDWESFTAIIGGHTSVDGATYATASGANVEATNKKDFSTWFVMLNAYSDKFTTPGHNDVKFEITFEDEDGFDEVVAIDQINGESINSSIEGDVYNMAGQRVGTSVEGLSKGLYIVNGKKVLVK